MPLELTKPVTTTLDKVRIEQFTVSPQLNVIMIHYSKGYTDENGQYVAKEYEAINFADVAFDPAVYNVVKDALYSLLDSKLNA